MALAVVVEQGPHHSAGHEVTAVGRVRLKGRAAECAEPTVVSSSCRVTLARATAAFRGKFGAHWVQCVVGIKHAALLMGEPLHIGVGVVEVFAIPERGPRHIVLMGDVAEASTALAAAALVAVAPYDDRGVVAVSPHHRAHVLYADRVGA